MNIDAITRSVPGLLPLCFFFLAIFSLLLAVVAISALQNRKYLRQQEVLQSYVFPQSYLDKVKTQYPHLIEDDLTIAFEQLRLYFTICRRHEPKNVAMPSKLVDQCWHAFITDTRHYQQFCDGVYGRFLHHMPRVEVCLPQIEETDDAGVANAESNEAKEQRLAVKGHELDAARVFHWAVMLQLPVQNGHQVSTEAGLDIPAPLLFTIDQDLHIPDGYFYSTEVIRFLANYDLKAAESTAASLDSTEGGSLGAGCGDAGVVCGGCGGST